MNPLCTVQDLSALIQVTVAVDDAPALAAIAAASAAIRGYCHQALSLVTGDHVVLSPACGRVLLPELPVVAVSAVSLAGTVLDPAAYGFEAATGELLRFDPLATPPPWPIWWDSGFRNVAVTYTHGYATLPDDLVNVCARVASRQYLGGLRSALVGPHARESDYAAVYQGKRLRTVFKRVGDRIIIPSLRETLASGGRGRWPAEKRPVRKHRMLGAEGRIAKGLRSVATDSVLLVGTSSGYGVWAQQGFTATIRGERPRKKKAMRLLTADGVRFAHAVKPHAVNVPRREFLILTAEDEEAIVTDVARSLDRIARREAKAGEA
jgi:phage gpG-like protein